MLRAFSDRPRGLFVTVDGPSGAGKSTVVEHLGQLLVAGGEEVHVTAEPSSGPIGRLCRELTETVTGHALACSIWYHCRRQACSRKVIGNAVPDRAIIESSTFCLI